MFIYDILLFYTTTKILNLHNELDRESLITIPELSF